jgi:hypothetical protein
MSIAPAFDEDFLWHGQDTFHDSFCQDLDKTESMVLATSERPTARRCFEEVTGQPAWKTKPGTSHASFATRPAAVLALIIRAADAV